MIVSEIAGELDLEVQKTLKELLFNQF